VGFFLFTVAVPASPTPALPEDGPKTGREKQGEVPYPSCAAAWKPAMRPNVAALQMPCWPNPPDESPHA
jgi:hypothetical protein